MANGSVKFFNATKGYGFISQIGGDDVFVHISSVIDGREDLQQGQRVEFDIATSPRTGKPEAVQVRVLA